ncbi:hypothetical protein GCM10009563_18430 [Subtercola frigoramans]
MHVDQTQPLAVQGESLHKVKDLIVLSARTQRKIPEQAQEGISIANRTQSKLTDNHWVLHNGSATQQMQKLFLRAMQMVDPDGGVYENHDETTSGSGPVTPSRSRLGVAAPEKRQPARTLALDERFKPLPHEQGLLRRTGQSSGPV